jgi:hypothetical protein
LLNLGASGEKAGVKRPCFGTGVPYEASALSTRARESCKMASIISVSDNNIESDAIDVLK